MKKVSDLKDAPYNPRKITAEQLDRLGKAMAEFGDLSGIVVNVRTGLIVSGHQRRKKLDPEWEIRKESVTDKTGTVAIGNIVTPWGLWSYREVDWPEKKERLANIAANKHGGEFDNLKLSEEIVYLDDGSQPALYDLLGFDQDEATALVKMKDEMQSGAREQPPDLGEKKTVVCPNCNHEFTP